MNCYRPLASLFLLAIAVFLLTAAAPFDRVPEGDELYTHIETISSAGLIDGYELPDGEISRLEAAVLVQQALNNYGSNLLKGEPADTNVENALHSLSTELGGVLASIGVDTGAMAAATGTTQTDELMYRLEYLESEVAAVAAAEEVAAEEPAVEDTCWCEEDECEEEDAIEVELFGSFQFHVFGTETDYFEVGETPGYSESNSDVDIYWGELGVEATDGTWTGVFSTLFNDEDDTIDLNEAYGQYNQPDGGWNFLVGRKIIPFGNNNFYFPTYPAVNDLGYTTVETVGGGYEGENWGMSAYFFNPEVEIEEEDDKISDYSVVWDIFKQDADECQDGFRLTAGYISHLAGTDLAVAGDSMVTDRTGGYNVFAQYDWSANRYHLLADYTAAAEAFAVDDLDVNADDEGDQPSALNLEFVYEPETDNLWGVSYQLTDELADYAEERYGLLYGRRLSDLVMLKLEYTHGEYDSAFASASSDDTFKAEFDVSF